MHSFVGQQIDVPLRLTKRLIIEVVEPLDDLVLELDRTSGHSRDAIPRC